MQTALTWLGAINANARRATQEMGNLVLILMNALVMIQYATTVLFVSTQMGVSYAKKKVRCHWQRQPGVLQ